MSLVGGGEGASAGDCFNRAIRADLAHPPVSQIRDVEIVAAVECEPIWLIELRRCGWSTVSREASGSGSGESLDASIGRDYAHTIGGGLSDIDVPRAVDGDSFGLAQRSRESRASIARIVGAGHGLNGVSGGETCQPRQRKENESTCHEYSHRE